MTRTLAFVVRTKLMLAVGRDEDNIEREQLESDLMKMAGTGMTPYVQWVLLNVTVEGLLEGLLLSFSTHLSSKFRSFYCEPVRFLRPAKPERYRASSSTAAMVS